MKKLGLVLLIAMTFISCSSDDCKQLALSERVSSQRSSLVTICHDGNTMQVNQNALQGHLNHGDSLGGCDVLSNGGLEFSDGEIVEIDCGFELPFMNTAEDGSVWFFSEPN